MTSSIDARQDGNPKTKDLGKRGLLHGIVVGKLRNVGGVHLDFDQITDDSNSMCNVISRRGERQGPSVGERPCSNMHLATSRGCPGDDKR